MHKKKLYTANRTAVDNMLNICQDGLSLFTVEGVDNARGIIEALNKATITGRIMMIARHYANIAVGQNYVSSDKEEEGKVAITSNPYHINTNSPVIVYMFNDYLQAVHRCGRRQNISILRDPKHEEHKRLRQEQADYFDQHGTTPYMTVKEILSE